MWKRPRVCCQSAFPSFDSIRAGCSRFFATLFDSCNSPTYNPPFGIAKGETLMRGAIQMRDRLILCLAAALFFFAQSPRAAAQAPSDKDAKTPETKTPEKCDAAATKEEVSTTDHTIHIGGQTIPYKATASTTLLKNDKGDATGLLYSVAYTRSDVKDLSVRPISFLYNGGPGSATMWLHMGALDRKNGVE